MAKLLNINVIFVTTLLLNAVSFGKEFISERELFIGLEMKLAHSPDIERLEKYISQMSKNEEKLDAEKEKESFILKNRKFIEKSLENGKKYIPMVLSVLVKHNLPPELVFIPAIESGYINGVTSSKGAAGIWQFVPQTARKFGLVVNRHVDERLDPIKSTLAAAKYIKYLYSVFGDWKLVLASYNAGHSKVISKISYHGSSFDSINRYLPKQTQNYIVKFTAFSQEGKKILLKEGLPKESKIEVVQVRGGYDIKTLAKISYIPEKELRELNKHFLKGVIPDDGNEYNFYVPKGYGEFVEAMLNKS